MTKTEALEWITGVRSMTNMVPPDPRETWIGRIAEADAAMTQQAYWALRAYTEGLIGKDGTGDSERYIDIVFDGPPSKVTGRFVEVENAEGASIDFGKWIEREDGYWVLRITDPPQRSEE